MSLYNPYFIFLKTGGADVSQSSTVPASSVDQTEIDIAAVVSNETIDSVIGSTLRAHSQAREMKILTEPIDLRNAKITRLRQSLSEIEDELPRYEAAYHELMLLNSSIRLLSANKRAYLQEYDRIVTILNDYLTDDKLEDILDSVGFGGQKLNQMRQNMQLRPNKAMMSMMIARLITSIDRKLVTEIAKLRKQKRINLIKLGRIQNNLQHLETFLYRMIAPGDITRNAGTEDEQRIHGLDFNTLKMIMNQSVARLQDEEDVRDNYILDDIISPDFLVPEAAFSRINLLNSLNYPGQSGFL